MKKNALYIVLLFICMLPLNAQTSVSPYRPGITQEGITYFLPSTGFHITMTATRTTYTPGEFALYAEYFLRLKDVTMEAYDKWELQEVKITPFGEADTTKAYTIQLNPKTSAPLVGLAPDGRLLSINATPAQLSQFPVAKTVEPIVDDNNGLLNSDYKNSEILSAGSKRKMAELAAAEIYDIRENRALLAKGQADFMPKDGEQLRLMFESLDKQEATLLKLFTGTKKSEKHTITISYVPKGETEDHVIARFSKHVGFVDADNLIGAPIYVSITDLHSLPAEVVDPNAKKNKKKENLDLRYTIPGKGNIKVYTLENDFTNVTFPMSQFGRIEHLGGELFNKKFTTRVTLSPETGGILRIDADIAN